MKLWNFKFYILLSFQDLPNYAQHTVPIFSLPQEWLWCESWCGNATKSKAKTIDLCNNPMTKEPKLQVRLLFLHFILYLQKHNHAISLLFLFCMLFHLHHSLKLVAFIRVLEELFPNGQILIWRPEHSRLKY